MNRPIVSALLMLIAVTVTSQYANAQLAAPRFSNDSRRRVARPTLSPYLDLMNRNRPTRSLTFEYLRHVRPELEYRRESRRYRSLRQLPPKQIEQRRPAPPKPIGFAPTGHTPRFLNHGGYFGSGTYRQHH